MAHAVVLTLGSLLIHAASVFLWDQEDESPILLILYACVAAAFLAWLSLPFVEWQPDR